MGETNEGIKEVSKEEAELIWSGKCPVPSCLGQLLAGPRGGLSQNVMCDTCGAMFNVPPRPWLPQRI